MAAQQDDGDEEPVYSDKDSGKENRRSAEMDELGSEVFNLKLALQEYEDRLAKLYQTEDRSKWKGPATLLSDLEVADREVDRLEHTVANLRNQLRAARGGSDGGGGDSEEKSDCVLSAKAREGHDEEFRVQIAALEEDNRVLADAAGWELCEGSEGEEEDALAVPTGPSQRIRVIEALSSRMKDLTLLLDSALARENDARVVAEDAAARMDDAVARTEELEAAVLHYKRRKVSAEGRESALKSEIDELRSRGGKKGGGGGGGAAVDGKEKAAVTVGVVARLTGREETSTKATGVNTEEGWPSVDASSNKLPLLEADALRWKEACERTNAQLRKERSLGEETAQRLSEKETTVRELTKRLREAEKTAAAAAAEAAVVGTRLPTGVRQHHDRISFERPEELHNTNENGGANRSREEQDDDQFFAAGDAAAEAATAGASNDSFDSYIGPPVSTASTDENAAWKGRARASVDTHKDAADAPRKNTKTGGAAAEGGHTRTSSPCTPGRGRQRSDDHIPPAPKQKVAAVTAGSGGAFHDEEGCGGEGQAGRGGTEQPHKQHLQRRPRWANQKRDVKQAGVGRAERLQQKQQPEEQPSPEGLGLDPRPLGFPASSARRRRRRSEDGVGIEGDFGAVGVDLGDIYDDEHSTAECSAETTGGGRDAVRVSFDVASDGDGVSSDEDEEVGVEGAEEPQAADANGDRTAPQPRQGWERWHQRQHSGRDGWRTDKGDDCSSSMPGDVSASGGERISAAPRAESAARRAEASALRAERAAESARVDRDGAELAAVEADAAVAAAKAALEIGGVPAPSHGYFTGANALRPQPTNSTLQQNPPADAGDVTTSQSERSSDTESRRAARLAERASLMARLEALAAATEAERVARSTTDRCGQIRTPVDGSIATIETTAPEEEKELGGWLEDEDLSIGRLERVAAVEPASGGAAGAFPMAGAGKTRASDCAQDVDYWSRPAAIAAAAATATKASQRHAPRRHRTSSKASRSKPSVALTGGGGAKKGLAARVQGAGESKSGAAGPPDGRHRTSQGMPKAPTIPLLSVGRKRLAEAGVGQTRAQGSAAVDATAVSREAARRRRVLQHVEVGRGGQEHYRDTAKQRAEPVEDGPLYGLGLGPNGADAFGNDGGERFSAQRRRPDSPEKVVRQQGADRLVGGAGVGTGMATGSLRPNKRSTKKRKSRPVVRAAPHTAPLGSRQALGYVHAHGALCARRCASPACPCGEAAAMAGTAWRFRPGVVGTRR